MSKDTRLAALIGLMAFVCVFGSLGCNGAGLGGYLPGSVCIEEIDDDGEIEYDDDCLEDLAYGGPRFYYDDYYDDYDYYYWGTVLGYGSAIYDSYFYDYVYYDGWYDDCWSCYYDYDAFVYWDAVFYDYYGY